MALFAVVFAIVSFSWRTSASRFDDDDTAPNYPGAVGIAVVAFALCWELIARCLQRSVVVINGDPTFYTPTRSHSEATAQSMTLRSIELPIFEVTPILDFPFTCFRCRFLFDRQP